LFDYSSAEKKEAEKNFLDKKEFIYESSFFGTVKEKKECVKCEINEYVLVIKLDSCFVKPTFSNMQYQPYYTYENDSIFVISVSKQLFELSNIRDIVEKKSNSNSIIVRNKPCMLLSAEKHTWIP
jgi:hypothetical protein